MCSWQVVWVAGTLLHTYQRLCRSVEAVFWSDRSTLTAVGVQDFSAFPFQSNLCKRAAARPFNQRGFYIVEESHVCWLTCRRITHCTLYVSLSPTNWTCSQGKPHCSCCSTFGYGKALSSILGLSWPSLSHWVTESPFEGNAPASCWDSDWYGSVVDHVGKTPKWHIVPLQLTPCADISISNAKYSWAPSYSPACNKGTQTYCMHKRAIRSDLFSLPCKTPPSV